MWMLIARRSEDEAEVVLLTSLPITNATAARLAYDQLRQRPRIEHTYRFDQEQGLDVEDMRVRSLKAMRRLFVLVLLNALFVAYLAATWPQSAIAWLRSLGGQARSQNRSRWPLSPLGWHQLCFYHRCHPHFCLDSSLPFLLFDLWIIISIPRR